MRTILFILTQETSTGKLRLKAHQQVWRRWVFWDFKEASLITNISLQQVLLVDLTNECYSQLRTKQINEGLTGF